MLPSQAGKVIINNNKHSDGFGREIIENEKSLLWTFNKKRF